MEKIVVELDDCYIILEAHADKKPEFEWGESHAVIFGLLLYILAFLISTLKEYTA